MKYLALARAQSIASILVKQEGIASERIFILDGAVESQTKELTAIVALKSQ